MKKTSNARNPGDQSTVIGHIDVRLAAAFARIGHVVRGADGKFSDPNDPGGGFDKQCLVEAKAHGLPGIEVSAKQADVRLEIDGGIARASRSPARQVNRRHAALQRKLALKRLAADSRANQHSSLSSKRA